MDELKFLNKFEMARKDYLKAKLRHNILESLVLTKDLPIEIQRRPEKLKVLTEGILMPNSTSQKLDATSVQILKAHIRKILLSRALSLTSHWQSLTLKTLGDYAKVAALPELVKTDLAIVRSHHPAISQEKISELISTHYDVLENLCTNYCLGKIKEYNLLRIEWNLAKKKTMELKMKCIEMEALYETYTPQAIKALEKIRLTISGLLHEVKSEIERIRATLSQYQAVGPEFESLVERFAKISSDVEAKKWALEELRNR